MAIVQRFTLVFAKNEKSSKPYKKKQNKEDVIDLDDVEIKISSHSDSQDAYQ